MKSLFPKFVAAMLILCSALMLCGCFFLHPRYDPKMPVSSVLGSPLVTGKWDDDVFLNEWTGISFTLPPGFWAEEEQTKIQGEYANDFLLYHDDYPDIVISLSYFDVTQGERREHTAEDYLNSSRRSLENNAIGREFNFKDKLTTATIAGWEYVKMSGVFVNTEDETQTEYNIDRYAYRWVGTMVVVVAMYDKENIGIVKDFLSSVENTL